MPATMFVGNLVYVAIAVVGGIMVAHGALPLGDIQAFIQYSRQFSQPLAQLGSMANLLQSGVASAERVFELLDADPRVGGRRTRPRRPSEHHGELRFENVAFRYVEDKPLIDDLSLVAVPGKTVAIVGPTGAGKTTLVNLIMRFYELDGGRITLDGVDIATMTRDDLRSRTGMVLQDTWLFEGTIRENIALRPPRRHGGGDPRRGRGRLRRPVRPRAARRLRHRARRQRVEHRAGEKQLITIARAFLARPSVLILDEATSSVDTRTELLVQHAMAELRKDRTSFVIAHRLSTIRDADLILVMEEGAHRGAGHARRAAREGGRLLAALRGAVRGADRRWGGGSIAARVRARMLPRRRRRLPDAQRRGDDDPVRGPSRVCQACGQQLDGGAPKGQSRGANRGEPRREEPRELVVVRDDRQVAGHAVAPRLPPLHQRGGGRVGVDEERGDSAGLALVEQPVGGVVPLGTSRLR